jgi:hypothetical protein
MQKIEELEKLIAQQQRTETLPPDAPLDPGERVATRKRPQAEKPRTPPPADKPASTTASTTPPPPPEKKAAAPAPGKTNKLAGIALMAVGAVAIIGGGVCSALAVGAGNAGRCHAASLLLGN